MRGVLRQPWARAAGWALGLALLAALLAWAAGPLRAASAGLTPADAFPLAGAAACVLASLAATSLLLSGLLRLFEHAPPVPRFTMFRLVVLSGLLNGLPLPRAGLWGRAAYLKARHGLSLRDSLRTLGLVAALSVAVLGVVAGGLLLTRGLSPGLRLAAAGGGVLGVCACGVAAARLWPGGWPEVGSGGAGSGGVWVLLRGLDLLAAAGRTALTLQVVGVGVGLPDALLLASGGLFVRLLGLTPNGIGLSEAAVAALAGAFTPVAAADAAAAALLDRAVELLTLLALAPLTGGLRGPATTPRP